MQKNNARRRGAIIDPVDVYAALQAYQQKKNGAAPEFFQKPSALSKCAQPKNKIEFGKTDCFNAF